MQHGNAFNHIRLSLCPVWALASKFWMPWPGNFIFSMQVHLQSIWAKFVCQSHQVKMNAITYILHFWYPGTSSEHLGQGRVSRSQGRGRTSMSKYKRLKVVCLWPKDGLVLTHPPLWAYIYTVFQKKNVTLFTFTITKSDVSRFSSFWTGL